MKLFSRILRTPNHVRLALSLVTLGMACLYSPARPENLPSDLNLLQYHRPYTWTYTVGESGFMNVLQQPEGISVLVITHFLNPPEEIAMTRKDGVWRASYTLTDTTVKMILYAFKASGASYMQRDKLLDNNYGKYYDLLVYDSSGSPVRGAYEARAISWTGFGEHRKEQLSLALENIKQELALYPGNHSARLLLYTVQLKESENDEAARKKIADDIEEVVRSARPGEEVYKFASAAYRLIGESEKTAEYEKKLVELNPKGDQAAAEAFEKIMKIESAEKREAELNGFLKSFPESRFSEFALSSLASLAIETEDSAAYTSLGDRILEKASTPASASALAGLAGVLSEKAQSLGSAEAYARKAIDVIRATSLEMRPPGVSIDEWKKQIKNTEARYQDILGWVYFQQGKTEAAVAELRKSSETAREAGPFYHLACALRQAGNTDESLRYFARSAAFGGDIGTMASEAFKELWNRSGQNPENMDAFLEGEQSWLKEDFRERVLSGRSVRKAPDFELEDIRGGWVRLSDQRETVVLVCFWATWSESSLRLLDALQKLASEYRDALFLTVATNKDMNSIEKFVDRHSIRLPVLVNEGADQSYGLQGVPTLFVIDKAGDIHFEHRGYRPDLNSLLRVELEDLL